MSHRTISIEVTGRGIATVTLNRPERGNALNPAMLDELGFLFTQWSADDDVRVVVVRAAGRNFCVGADIGGNAGDKPQGQAGASPGVKLVDLLIGLDALPKPTVAVVQGGCIGGGLAIVACCDIVLADEGAFFSIPEARLGFAASALLPLFVRAIGYRQFRRYGLSGERITAAEAKGIGLVHQCCRTAMLQDALAGVLDALLHASPNSIKDFKAAAAQYAPPRLSDLPLEELESKFHASRTSPEAIEGIASFREKRKPRWYPEP